MWSDLSLCYSSRRYPQPVMDKIKDMGEGIVVEDAPVHKTTKEIAMAKGKRSATTGNAQFHFTALWLISFQVNHKQIR